MVALGWTSSSICTSIFSSKELGTFKLIPSYIWYWASHWDNLRTKSLDPWTFWRNLTMGASSHWEDRSWCSSKIGYRLSLFWQSGSKHWGLQTRSYRRSFLQSLSGCDLHCHPSTFGKLRSQLSILWTGLCSQSKYCRVLSHYERNLKNGGPSSAIPAG